MKDLEKNNKQVVTTYLNTPIGEMLAGATENGICYLEFADCLYGEEMQQKHYNTVFQEGESPYFAVLRNQLAAYFARKRREFELPLDFFGTPFQQTVWEGLTTLEYGTSISYQTQSVRLKKPNAIRAIARANGENRMAILVPCHRVVGKDGQLNGYRWGLWRKQFLLELEQAISTSSQYSLF